MTRARLEFGQLACTRGVPNSLACQCKLCQLEDLEAPVESVTWITQDAREIADTKHMAERFRRETKMTNIEMFNPSARDGVFTWVALRLVVLSLVAALVASVL